MKMPSNNTLAEGRVLVNFFWVNCKTPSKTSRLAHDYQPEGICPTLNEDDLLATMAKVIRCELIFG